MSAETLRRAAALMRERGEAATPGPWVRAERWDRAVGQVDGPWVAETTALGQATAANAEHIASWHPAVALAVADWLAECARLWEYGDVGPLMWQQANTVARAYLGEQP